MINYLEEVDFAKQIQMLNSKFVSRMVSMQSELEIPCTELYRKLISFGGYDIDEVDIDNIYFEWARPKALNSQTSLISLVYLTLLLNSSSRCIVAIMTKMTLVSKIESTNTWLRISL